MAGAAKNADEALACLVHGIAVQASQSSRRYSRWRKRYEALHYTLGIVGASLAAVAGATAFANSVATTVVGLLAAAAAALAGIQTVVRAERSAQFNQAQEFAVARTANRATVLLEVRWGDLSPEERVAEYENLFDEYAHIRESAPQ